MVFRAKLVAGSMRICHQIEGVEAWRVFALRQKQSALGVLALKLHALLWQGIARE